VTGAQAGEAVRTADLAYREYTVREVGVGGLYGPAYRFRDDAERELADVRWMWPARQWEVVERDVTISSWRPSPGPEAGA
jgi:hypothetical protein